MSDGGKVYNTIEGPGAVREAIRVVKSMPELNELKWSDILSEAASEHCDNLGSQGIISRKGSDGQTALQRVARYAQIEGESIASMQFGTTSGATGHLIVEDLFINDGVRDRKHRKRMLNPNFQLTGISHCKHASKHNNMTVILYAQGLSSEHSSG